MELKVVNLKENHNWQEVMAGYFTCCLVAHFKDGKLLPPCRKCDDCGWVPYPYNQPCKKDN